MFPSTIRRCAALLLPAGLLAAAAPAGASVVSFGPYGSAPGSFTHVVGVAVSGDTLSVLDAPDAKVARIELSPISPPPSPMPPSVSIPGATGTSLLGGADEGEIYMTTATGSAHYNSTGTLVDTAVINSLTFDTQHGVASHLPISDLDAPTVRAVAYARDLTAYVAYPNRVVKFDPVGTRVATWGANGGDGTAGSGPAQFSDIRGIAVDGNGFVYVSDAGNGRVQRLTPAGQFAGAYGPTGPTSPRFDELTTGQGALAVHGARVFVATDHHVVGIDTDAAYPAVAVTAPGAPRTAAGTTVVAAGSTVTLDASASSLPTSSPVHYTWDLDGSRRFATDTGTSPTLTTTVPRNGVAVRMTFDGKTVTANAPLRVVPATPAGPVGVTIARGAPYTNTAAVYVTAVWPGLQAAVEYAADPSFSETQQALFGTDPTQLVLGPAHAPDGPLTVYARFGLDFGAYDGPVYTDTIVLDRTAPRLTAARTLRVRGTKSRRTTTVSVKASDATSGVLAVQGSPDRRAIVAATPAHGRASFRTPQTIRWIRAVDRAGNTSSWHRVAARRS